MYCKVEKEKIYFYMSNDGSSEVRKVLLREGRWILIENIGNYHPLLIHLCRTANDDCTPLIQGLDTCRGCNTKLPDSVKFMYKMAR